MFKRTRYDEVEDLLPEEQDYLLMSRNIEDPSFGDYLQPEEPNYLMPEIIEESSFRDYLNSRKRQETHKRRPDAPPIIPKKKDDGHKRIRINDGGDWNDNEQPVRMNLRKRQERDEDLVPIHPQFRESVRHKRVKGLFFDEPTVEQSYTAARYRDQPYDETIFQTEKPFQWDQNLNDLIEARTAHTGNPKSVCFKPHEVRSLIEQALEEQERHLRYEYLQILIQRLEEKYNEWSEHSKREELQRIKELEDYQDLYN